MEQAHDLIRPWRRATIAVSAVAAVELVLLGVLAILLLGNPIARHFRESAAAAAAPRVRTAVPAPAKKPTLSRSETSVMVLNGNGQAGAAHAAADRVQAHGYMLGNVGNESDIELLESRRSDSDPVLREHLDWAIAEIAARDSTDGLRSD